MNRFRIITGFVVVLMVLLGCLIGILLFTTQGIEAVIRATLSQQAAQEDIQFKEIDGTLVEGVTFENLAVQNLNHLPAGSTLLVQRLFVNLTSLTIDGLVVDIENARLQMPGSRPIVLRGSFRDGQLDVNVYTNGLTLDNLLNYFPAYRASALNIKGTVNDVDLFIKGDYSAPRVTGEFVLEWVTFKGIALRQTYGRVDLLVKNWMNDLSLLGDVFLDQGVIQSKRTHVTVEKSKIGFNGPPDNPLFDLEGRSTVDKVEIRIVLKGSLNEPDLQLSSKPSVPRENIMLMLATGQRWKGLETSLATGGLSANLTKDFVNYFLFAGRGNSFARQFGLKEISVDYSETTQGISATKSLTDRIDVGFGVEKSTDKSGEETTTHSIDSEVKVTDTISLELQQETKTRKPETSTEDPSSIKNQKVLFKFEKEF